jgi:Wax ester synthase-like Acyl-CoA acyltransferase domain
MRLHHTIADGVSGIAILAAFLDTDPTPSAPPVPTPAPAPRPSARDLFCRQPAPPHPRVGWDDIGGHSPAKQAAEPARIMTRLAGGFR